METRALRVHLARASRTICGILRVVIACVSLYAAIAGAQEPGKVAIVAVLANAASMDQPLLSDFRRALREQGYVEGSNLRIEFRTTRGDATQLARVADELVNLKPDAIFVTSTSGAIALKHASNSIPVVMVRNPAGTELTTSLARPTANVTGKTAQALGLKVPDSLLQRADRTIR